jgi:hypothetical protein
MRVALAVLAWTFLVSGACFAESQSVQEVSLCRLRQHSSEFDHKLVRVRGTASLGFENFTLYDQQCNDSTSTSVWLTFGGDVSDIAIYCCGNHSREPGHNIKIEGESVSLLKDAAFDQFYKLLRASRNRMPNGDTCSSDCHFYRVSATLTGLFLANKQGTFAGYGHFGCCSLLVIRQVSMVSAQQNAVPLGTFNCAQTHWNPPPEELPELDNYLECASSCDQQKQAAITRVAAHWNDIVSRGDFSGTYSSPGAEFHLGWISEDWLTSYTVAGERGKPPKFTVTREACMLERNTLTGKDPISCAEYASSSRWGQKRQLEFERLIEKGDYSLAEKMMADSAEQVSSKGDQSWRNKTLQEAAQSVRVRETSRWRIAVDSDLRADKCTDFGLDQQQYSYMTCSWYSRDGMQEFSVNLMQRKAVPKSPWLLKSASARVCHADASLATAIIHPN